MIQHFGGDAMDEEFRTLGSPLNLAGRTPSFVKMMADIADSMFEHGAIRGEGFTTQATPEEARGKITELNAELKKLPEGHPRTLEIINEIVSLTNAANRRR
jgi:hypothetical protein